MENQTHQIPRIAIRSIAIGLLMMAFFTIMWAGIASSSIHGAGKAIEIIFFGVLVVAFISYAVYFFLASKHFPKLSTQADKERGKKEGMWFGIIFGGEGLGIFIAINIVNNMGHHDLVIPVIALVVGLHFYPMAKLFKRSVDYYIASWSTLIATCSIVFTLNKAMAEDYIILFVGIGMAISTTCYGLYMIHTGRGLIKKMPLDVQSAVL